MQDGIGSRIRTRWVKILQSSWVPLLKTTPTQKEVPLSSKQEPLKNGGCCLSNYFCVSLFPYNLRYIRTYWRGSLCLDAQPFIASHLSKYYNSTNIYWAIHIAYYSGGEKRWVGNTDTKSVFDICVYMCVHVWSVWINWLAGSSCSLNG